MTTRCLARWGIALTIAASLASASNHSAAAPLTLRLDPRTTLEIVARRMGVVLGPEVPLPTIRFESATPIERFRDAVEAQWGSRPRQFSNAYVAARNEIYLIDDPAYYGASGRTLDDSLAHELVHYLQARYGGADLAGADQEMEAVEVQTWFRTKHMRARLAKAGR